MLNFDSAPGSNNSLVDSSGAGNNAAFTNAIYSANTGHNGSGAMSFSAGGGVVTVPDSPSLAVTNNVTLEAWVNLTTPLSALTGIVGKSGAYALAVDQNGSVSMSIVPGLSGSFVGSSPKIPLNAWTHVAASYDGLEVKIFVNGVMTSLTPYAAGPIAASTAPVYIGGGSTTAGLTGLVDEVKISAIAKTFADRVPAYAMYGSSGVATPVGDTVIPITGAYNEQGISHSGNAIHFSQPGAYLVTAGARVQSTGDVWQAFAIAKAGTIVAMSNGWGSVNSGDAGQQSATWLMTVDSTTADYTVLYRVRDAPGGGGIAECGFAGQSNCGARITFVRLGP